MQRFQTASFGSGILALKSRLAQIKRELSYRTIDKNLNSRLCSLFSLPICHPQISKPQIPVGLLDQKSVLVSNAVLLSCNLICLLYFVNIKNLG